MRTQIVSLQKMINMRSNEEHDIEINSGGKIYREYANVSVTLGSFNRMKKLCEFQ